MNTMYSVLIINEGGNSRLAAVLVGFFVLGTRTNPNASQLANDIAHGQATTRPRHTVTLVVSRAMAFVRMRFRHVSSSCVVMCLNVDSVS